MTTAPPLLDGITEIVKYLESEYGLQRSAKTVRKWLALPRDPLPAFPVPGGRGVVCDKKALDAWWRRQADAGRRGDR